MGFAAARSSSVITLVRLAVLFLDRIVPSTRFCFILPESTLVRGAVLKLPIAASAHYMNLVRGGT